MIKPTAISLWIPRIAGVVLAVFLSLFALDAFGEKPFADALPEFLIHLAPALIVVAAVALAWRHPLSGAAAFVALAVGYAAVGNGRLDWIAAISGPLAMVGVLFLVSGLRRAGAGTVSD